MYQCWPRTGPPLKKHYCLRAGRGAFTPPRHIVAQELHLALSSIQVQLWDTDGVLFDTGVGGSRVARVAGQATYQAARQASREVFSMAADLLGWLEEQMTLRGAEVMRQDPGEATLGRVLQRQGRPVAGRGSVQEPNPSPVASFAAQVAEVLVDQETGEVKPLRFTTAHDDPKVPVASIRQHYESTAYSLST